MELEEQREAHNDLDEEILHELHLIVGHMCVLSTTTVTDIKLKNGKYFTSVGFVETSVQSNIESNGIRV